MSNIEAVGIIILKYKSLEIRPFYFQLFSL